MDRLDGIEWFENSNMILNQDNCNLIFLGHNYENIFASVGQSMIWETENQKLLGIIIDCKLNFSDYVTSICKKAGKNYLRWLNKEGLFLKTFIESVNLLIAFWF